MKFVIQYLFIFMLSMLSKQRPFATNFNFQSNKKLHGVRSVEFGGWVQN